MKISSTPLFQRSKSIFTPLRGGGGEGKGRWRRGPSRE